MLYSSDNRHKRFVFLVFGQLLNDNTVVCLRDVVLAWPAISCRDCWIYKKCWSWFPLTLSFDGLLHVPLAWLLTQIIDSPLAILLGQLEKVLGNVKLSIFSIMYRVMLG
jgi:hypothetical protein